MEKNEITHFSNALESVLNVITGRELAKISELSEGTVSQYKSGSIKPTVKSLSDLLRALKDKPELVQKLLCAHLIDECPSDFRSALKKQFEQHPLLNHQLTDVVKYSNCDKDLEEAIKTIKEAACMDKKSREFIIVVAKYFR